MNSAFQTCILQVVLAVLKGSLEKGVLGSNICVKCWTKQSLIIFNGDLIREFSCDECVLCTEGSLADLSDSFSHECFHGTHVGKCDFNKCKLCQ